MLVRDFPGRVLPPVPGRVLPPGKLCRGQGGWAGAAARHRGVEQVTRISRVVVRDASKSAGLMQ
eukprot:10534421-Heterocapsa_arctica.AAC.1